MSFPDPDGGGKHIRTIEPDIETEKDLAGSIVFFGLASFLILDRTIPDLYVLPVGFSLKMSHVGAAGVIMLFVWATFLNSRPPPRGVSGALGVLAFAAVVLGPFVNEPSLSTYEANAVDLGLMSATLYGGLFVAAHYVGQIKQRARTLAYLVIGLTSLQAGVAGFERWSGWLLARDTSLLTFGFLIPDPGLARGFVFGSSRIGGGFRPVSTAPHPIVLSALCAIAVACVIALYPYVDRNGRRWVAVSLVPLMFGLVAVETRTGIVIVAVAGLASLSIVFVKKAGTVMPFVFIGGLFAGVSLALFPSSARTLLNQFARLGSDPSVSARTSDVSFVPEIMAARPWLGPGYLTHNPAIRLFDNAYFVGLIELGVVGFGFLFLFILTATFRPLLWSRNAAEAEAPVLVIGLAAGLSLLVGMTTFDALSFAQFFPTTLILLGLGLGKTDEIARRSSALAQENVHPNSVDL